MPEASYEVRKYWGDDDRGETVWKGSKQSGFDYLSQHGAARLETMPGEYAAVGCEEGYILALVDCA